MSFAVTNDKLLSNLLSASAQRYKVLANNLANQDTAGYKRSIVRFEDLLAKELSATKPDILSVVPVVEEDLITPSSPDGNNVNPELELNGMAQNRLQYEMYSAILSGRAQLLRAAIQGGR